MFSISRYDSRFSHTFFSNPFVLYSNPPVLTHQFLVSRLVYIFAGSRSCQSTLHLIILAANYLLVSFSAGFPSLPLPFSHWTWLDLRRWLGCLTDPHSSGGYCSAELIYLLLVDCLRYFMNLPENSIRKCIFGVLLINDRHICFSLIKILIDECHYSHLLIDATCGNNQPWNGFIFASIAR